MGTTDGAVQGATVRLRNLTKPASVKTDLADCPLTDPVARQFWDMTAGWVNDAGNLAPPELPLFIELCDTYSILQSAKARLRETGEGFKTWQDCSTQFRNLAAKFLLFPSDRRQKNISYRDNSERHDGKGLSW